MHSLETFSSPHLQALPLALSRGRLKLCHQGVLLTVHRVRPPHGCVCRPALHALLQHKTLLAGVGGCQACSFCAAGQLGGKQQQASRGRQATARHLEGPCARLVSAAGVGRHWPELLWLVPPMFAVRVHPSQLLSMQQLLWMVGLLLLLLLLVRPCLLVMVVVVQKRDLLLLLVQLLQRSAALLLWLLLLLLRLLRG